MRILILSVYPVKEPRHGGQIRVRNIIDAYSRAGHEVLIRGVLSASHYRMEEGFVSFPGYSELAKILKHPHLMEDMLVGRFVCEDLRCFRRLQETIDFIPDVVQIEHPWLFRFYEKNFGRMTPRPLLVYSSHNVEFEIKEKILRTSYGESLAAEYSDLIRQEELCAIQAADAVLCVSEYDQKWISEVTDKPILRAPNGVRSLLVTERGLAEARRVIGGGRYALFCASMYPPNVNGFLTVFSGGFGSLSPSQSLVVAGSVGYALVKETRFSDSALLAERSKILGEVSGDCLDVLLANAHCIVLPIGDGGGTNLKTAEAIYSGKYVVCTKVAMRGFESFLGDAGIFVAEDASDFKRKLRLVMGLEPLILSEVDKEKRRKLLWTECLGGVSSFVEGLVAGRRG